MPLNFWFCTHSEVKNILRYRWSSTLNPVLKTGSVVRTHFIRATQMLALLMRLDSLVFWALFPLSPCSPKEEWAWSVITNFIAVLPIIFCTVNYVEAQQHALLSLKVEFWHLFYNSSIKNKNILRYLWAMEKRSDLRTQFPYSRRYRLEYIAFLLPWHRQFKAIPGSTGPCIPRHTQCHCRL